MDFTFSDEKDKILTGLDSDTSIPFLLKNLLFS